MKLFNLFALGLIGSLSLVALAPKAEAQGVGMDLLKQCRVYKSIRDGRDGFGVDGGVCAGYFLATTGYYKYGIPGEPKQRQACLPNMVSLDQVILVFMRFAEMNPQKLSLPKEKIIHDAFLWAWPC